MSYRRRAFSLVEILIGIVFLVFALLGMLQMNQISNRGAMDSQFELLANCLANEPIEVYQHLGYAWLKENPKGLPAYPIGGSIPIPDEPFANVKYPISAVHFQRGIEIEALPENDGVKGFRMRVAITPVDGGAAAVWLSRDQVRQEALILEE